MSSKAALNAYKACAASEFQNQGISFTTVNMPLVSTPMTALTKIYESMALLDLDVAADMVEVLQQQANPRCHYAKCHRSTIARRGATFDPDHDDYHFQNIS